MEFNELYVSNQALNIEEKPVAKAILSKKNLKDKLAYLEIMAVELSKLEEEGLRSTNIYKLYDIMSEELEAQIKDLKG